MPRRLVAIVGATATGKTALAVELARLLDGEIVNADSRQVYRGMDIGTAKPTAAERRAARHWLIDVADPPEGFTLATYVDLARAALDDIWKRETTPIVVGGTGQYVWALLEGWSLPRVPPDRDLRARLEALASSDGSEALVAMLREIDPASAESIDPRNVRRLLRAIEVTQATGVPFSAWQRKDPPDYGSTIIGLRLDREELYARIDRRVDAMIDGGLVDEVRRLLAEGVPGDAPALSSIGYRQIVEHLAGECSLADAVSRIKTETHRLARMQHTWFRPSDERIHWLDAQGPALVERAAGVLRGAGFRIRMP